MSGGLDPSKRGLQEVAPSPTTGFAEKVAVAGCATPLMVVGAFRRPLSLAAMVTEWPVINKLHDQDGRRIHHLDVDRGGLHRLLSALDRAFGIRSRGHRAARQRLLTWSFVVFPI